MSPPMRHTRLREQLSQKHIFWPSGGPNFGCIQTFIVETIVASLEFKNLKHLKHSFSSVMCDICLFFVEIVT